MTYIYPDHNDRITEKMIQSVSCDDYWKESEDHTLSIAVDEIRKMPRVYRMLDLGCGMGRLFPVFAPLADSLLGLEPDQSRYEAAKASAAMLPEQDIEVLRADSSVLKDEDQFEVILSSHVIQHIPPALCVSMVSDICQHTRAGGLVILTTTHTDREQDVFTIETMVEERRKTEEVDRERFLSSFEEDGVLPVRLFAERTVPELFRQYGFELVCRRRFHYDGAESVTYDDRANEEVYGTDCRSDQPMPKPVLYTARARDVFYVFRKEIHDEDRLYL